MDMFGSLVPFDAFLCTNVMCKIAEAGGGGRDRSDLWQRLRAKSAPGYPQTLEIFAEGPLGSKITHPWNPLDPEDH